MRPTLRVTTIAVLSIAPVMIAACGGGNDGPTPPSVSAVAGTYTLMTIAGKAVPTQYGPSATDSVTDDKYTLHADATYGRIGHQRYYASGQERTIDLVDTGTVTLYARDSIRFDSKLHPSAHIAGTVVSNTLTLQINPGPFVYQR